MSCHGFCCVYRTGLALVNTQLLPNRALKSMIAAWLAEAPARVEAAAAAAAAAAASEKDDSTSTSEDDEDEEEEMGAFEVLVETPGGVPKLRLLVSASIEAGKLLPSKEVSRVTRELGLCLPEGEIRTAFPCLPLPTWLATEASMDTRSQRLCLREEEAGTMLPCFPCLLWPTRLRS